jgi:hypothetical protein
MTQPFGWNTDPYGLHEHRYFSGGQPTKLVRDGGRESYDEPPDSPPPVVQPDPVSPVSPVSPMEPQPSPAPIVHPAPVSPMEPQLSPVAVATRPDVRTAVVNEAQRVDDRPSPPSRRRRLVPLLAVAAAVVLVVALVVVLSPGSGSPPQRSACSLLTSTEASALLGYGATTLHNPAGNLGAGMNSCSFGPSASEMRELEHHPESFEQSYKSLQLTIRNAPTGFPGTAFRKFATPVSVDGQTAWWASLQPVPVPGPSSSSSHALVAVKDGQEIMVQLTTTGQAEAIDQRAMADSLPRV